MDILSALRQASVKVFGQGEWLKYFGKLFIFWWIGLFSEVTHLLSGMDLLSGTAFANWHDFANRHLFC